MVINVVSFFSGVGGSSLGYQHAGCKVILACDWERKATETYRLNFPNTQIIQADIRNITGEMIRKIIGNIEIDILDGSPPCTPFSMAGKREGSWGKKYIHSADSRAQRTDDLFFEFIRLIDELKPKSFLAENVKGLIMGKAKGYFKRIKREMEVLGYHVETFLLNAKDFEVPQSRERVFFIGFRNDLKLNHDAKLTTMSVITFKQAMIGLINPLKELEQSKINPSSMMSKFLHLQKEGKTRDKSDPKSNGYTHMRLSYDKPSPTLNTHEHIIFHPKEHRRLTLSETKRLSSFPDEFKFIEIKDGKERLGNCVPPNLIKHVVNYMIKKIDYFGVAPNQNETTSRTGAGSLLAAT